MRIIYSDIYFNSKYLLLFQINNNKRNTYFLNITNTNKNKEYFLLKIQIN